MQRDYIISVAMATYNGEKYIKEQLDSILCQLKTDDEIIISDDGSTDKTINIINSYNDKRIKIIEGPRKGVKQNFANAIDKCSGKYIFLSDQDDIWGKEKVIKILKVFSLNEKIKEYVHDCRVVNNDMRIVNESFYRIRNSKPGIIKNIWKNSYIGCCMAFDSKLKEKILPIPNDIEMHDQWIGILGEIKGKGSIFLKEKLIKYRRHSNNVSQMTHYGVFKMIKNRIVLIKNLIK